jgi:hypothetical protein
MLHVLMRVLTIVLGCAVGAAVAGAATFALFVGLAYLSDWLDPPPPNDLGLPSAGAYLCIALGLPATLAGALIGLSLGGGAVETRWRGRSSPT